MKTYDYICTLEQADEYYKEQAEAILKKHSSSCLIMDELEELKAEMEIIYNQIRRKTNVAEFLNAYAGLESEPVGKAVYVQDVQELANGSEDIFDIIMNSMKYGYILALKDNHLI